MDPIAIVGLTATTAKLVQLCMSSAKGLHHLYPVQKRAGKALLSIERECLTLRAAVEGIEVWSKSKNARAKGRQAQVNSLNDVLQAFIPSIEVLLEDVECMLKTIDGNGKLSVAGRFSYVWGKREMSVLLNELRWQSQHVHMLITVVNM
jgi:hypothetical protein